jgi:hypothetical protein
MKYQKTVNLWQENIQERILSGEIRLQAGQYVWCGSDKLSRFVRIKGNSLWVAHPQGSAKETRARFQSLLSIK